MTRSQSLPLLLRRPVRLALLTLLLALSLAAGPLTPSAPSPRAQTGQTEQSETPATDSATDSATEAPATPANTPAAPKAPAATQPASATQPGAAGPAGSALPSGANVAVIGIDGMIYDFTFESIKRRVKRALNQGASVIVFDMNTPGGVVTSALEISKYLKTVPVPTVAWINNKAYSAGIMIASACDQIVMSPAAATGDCAPIVPGKEIAPTERAKKLSPILQEFRANARQNHYDFAMFHAMCVLGVEVYCIENPRTGQRRLVNQADYAVMVDGLTIDQANKQVKGNTGGGWFGIGQTGSGQKQQRWDIAIPNCEVATPSDRGQWQPVTTLPSGDTLPNGQVHDGRTLLTIGPTRAQDIGLSQAEIASEAQLRQHLKASQVQRISPTWSESLAGFLVHPMVRGILVLALLLGAYVEFQTPGVGVAGAVALAALVTLLGAPFLVGLAEVWHIILFFVGLLLLVTELAFIPGFGVLGVGGLILMFIGLVLMAVPGSGGGNLPGLPPAHLWDRVVASAMYLMMGVGLSLIGFYILARHFGSVPILNRLVLQADQPAAASAALPASGDETLGEGQVQIGHTGTVTTGLRPSGRAEINGQIVDVVSYGQWYQPGQQVRVVEVHGNRIVVDSAE